MIAQLIDYARPRVAAADAVQKTDETLAVVAGTGQREQVSRQTSAWCQLRVRWEGRTGYAGGTPDGNWPGLVEHALAAARGGAVEDLFLPAAAPAPFVPTAQPLAGAAGPDHLVDLARILLSRFDGDGRDLEVWVERSAGQVEVANTRDVAARYDATLVGVGVRLTTAANREEPLEVQHVATSWPATSEVEALIAEVSGRLEPPLLGEASLPETLRVWLAPRATTKLFRPLLRGLTAGTLLERAAPLRFRLGEHVAPEAISLTDDPLRPLRPGSRPVDDEGVVSRIVPLVERGRLVGWIADLVTGARLGIPSTGHGRRWPFAPPRPAFSNLCLVPGEASPEDLSSAARDGVLIRDLPIVTADAGGGRIAAETPWAYRLAGEEVVGRLPRLRLRGNLHRMLDRLVALGREAEWLGSWCSPGLVLDAVEVSLC